MVYDNLFTRSHHEVYANDPYHREGAPSSIILVTQHLISPIHLACKLLSTEAGPFLKAKIMRLSTPWAAPRIILDAATIRTACALGGFIDSLIYMIKLAKEHPSNVEEASKDMHLHCQVSKGQLEGVKTFAERTGKYMLNSRATTLSWHREAQKLYADKNPSRERLLPTTSQAVKDRHWAEVEETFLKEKASARNGLMQFAVSLGDKTGPELDLTARIFEVAGCCRFCDMKAVLYTVGSKIEENSELHADDCLRYDGEMSKKTWNEEWA